MSVYEMNNCSDILRRDLEICKNGEGYLNQCLIEHKNIKEKLTELPKHVEQDIMIPFNSVALLPSTIKHTNEYIVCIGSDVYCKKTAHQVSQFLERKISCINQELVEIGKARSILENNIKIDSNTKETVNIKEDIETFNYKNRCIQN
uniref:Unconventional prefoldin RPB5 interactor (Trinotate prediction) n=1 Tax=Henneguya salminicola TaxID=69463 RepID=A0A6G3MGL6_HENSL